MTRTIVFRRIVGIVAVALALGAIAGPAWAGTVELNSNGSYIQQPPPSIPAAACTDRANAAQGQKTRRHEGFAPPACWLRCSSVEDP